MYFSAACVESKLARIESIIQEKKIDFIRLEQTDIHGISRSKIILSKNIRNRAYKGQFMPPMLSIDVASNDVNAAGFLQEISFGDFLNFPDLNTFFVIPWADSTASVTVEPYNQHKNAVLAHPRWLAKHQLQNLATMGLTLMSCFEHEFFITNKDCSPLETSSSTRSTIRNTKYPKMFHQIFKQVPGEMYSFESEGGPGQYEISCKPAWGLAGADEAFAFKTAVKEIAHQHGHIITFMTKPFPDWCGSSAHYNYSVWDEKKQRNVFFDGDGTYNLSVIGESWVSTPQC